MIKRLSFLIRRLTIPPVFAVLLLVLVYWLRPGDIGSPLLLAISLFCLAVLPTLAYPMQRFLKGFKDRGREGQRTLAMLFSFAGYVLAVAFALFFSAPDSLLLICLEYLCCGVAILLFNKGLHMKASGHACGVVGPVLLALCFELYVPAAVGALLILPVFYASIKTGRHTGRQLLGGAAISVGSLAMVAALLAFL